MFEYYIARDRFGNYDLCHGARWRKHKYIRKEGNRYIYPEDLKTSTEDARSSSTIRNNVQSNTDLVRKNAEYVQRRKNNNFTITPNYKTSGSEKTDKFFDSVGAYTMPGTSGFYRKRAKIDKLITKYGNMTPTQRTIRTFINKARKFLSKIFG